MVLKASLESKGRQNAQAYTFFLLGWCCEAEGCPPALRRRTKP